jgi:hypothetical protein
MYYGQERKLDFLHTANSDITLDVGQVDENPQNHSRHNYYSKNLHKYATSQIHSNSLILSHLGHSVRSLTAGIVSILAIGYNTDESGIILSRNAGN